MFYVGDIITSRELGHLPHRYFLVTGIDLLNKDLALLPCNETGEIQKHTKYNSYFSNSERIGTTPRAQKYKDKAILDKIKYLNIRFKENKHVKI